MFDSVDLSNLLPSSLGQQEEEDDGWVPALSWRDRVIGCVSCMVVGYILSFGSFFRVRDLILGNAVPFVVNATAGNILALCGSCFVSGPSNQLKKMFHETRKWSTIAYLISLVLTLVVAFAPFKGPKWIILIILLLVQYCAITWYCLSYIPFAREAVSGMCWRFVSDAD